ncbi:MAG: 4-hydroxy-tetrahydrodipicolinate synthase [Magnetococcales bacterium]|nr:4-hydroxy-tetrahydrodipicolinate synthase [Magnetococcales bacterium]
MFEGVIPALITPFEDGRIDRVSLKRLIDHQIEGGVHAIVPCGTTGESATLTHDEHKELITLCLEYVDGRVPVIAGTGSNSTSESIALTHFAKVAGVAGALLITPYYNKPTQEGLYQHYKAVAEAVDIPIVLYNVPGRTSVDMVPSTVTRLAKIPNIVAIKEATADLERASVIRDECGDALTLISGDDATFLPFLSIGGRGAISVTANLVPDKVVAIWNHWQAGETQEALAIHQQLLTLNRLLFCQTSPIPVKAAAAMMGLCRAELRLPLTPLDEPFGTPLQAALKQLGVVADGS